MPLFDYKTKTYFFQIYDKMHEQLTRFSCKMYTTIYKNLHIYDIMQTWHHHQLIKTWKMKVGKVSQRSSVYRTNLTNTYWESEYSEIFCWRVTKFFSESTPSLLWRKWFTLCRTHFESPDNQKDINRKMNRQKTVTNTQHLLQCQAATVLYAGEQLGYVYIVTTTMSLCRVSNNQHVLMSLPLILYTPGHVHWFQEYLYSFPWHRNNSSKVFFV